MKKLNATFKYFLLLFLMVSFIGCEKEDDEELPAVTAEFTYSLNAETGTARFINTSENANSYTWSFGNGSTSTEANPIVTFSVGSYTVTLTAKNVAGDSDTFEDDILYAIADNEAPVITLIGDATMNVTLGETFTDPGATASDNIEGNLSSSIVVAGDVVDANTAGTYTITYNVSDFAGNAATEITRTVKVAADATAPVITLVGNATINLTVGDAFTDPGAEATDNKDGDITANIIIAGDVVDVNTAGTYTITYNVSDAAGNAATELTRTVNVNNAANGDGDYLFATSATVTIPNTIEDWGSGTTIVTDHSGDATYNPSIKLTSGTAWGDVSALAFTGIETGKLAEYGMLEFKIKTTDYTTIKVKIPENELTFNISEGTSLADGWVQMSLPLSSWKNEVAAADQFAILEFGAGTILVTDVKLSGEPDNSGGGGGGTSDCPAAPAGELLSNGNFEAGDVGCWQFFQGSSISTTVNNGGSKSAEIQGTTGAAVGLKQERFGAGTVLPNTSYTVTFDIMADGPFGEGGLLKAFAFSEGADGGSVGATLHTLTDNTTAISTSWETKTYTFTTPGNANQVEGGISFLIEIVNSSVKLNVDNVVIKKTP
ncbi:immunoglobulin-like domain-containing protein [Flavicella sediminum]|uniref:immunoglobulin-like domain-containing protein n=1 Tax=Flavicella sediminum TaxID=2585141 RepID=UPI00111E7911|nr:immunoglobulin-like domain-containing protein [Flavicella sediminum]